MHETCTLFSLCLTGIAHGPPGVFGSLGLGVDFIVVETSLGWSDTVLLSHLEVLTEVLVTAPPVQVDHAQSLVSSLLRVVRVFEIVLLSVNWETTILMGWAMLIVDLTNSVSPVRGHVLLHILNDSVRKEGLVQVPGSSHPDESKTVLTHQWCEFPVKVTVWVLEGTGNVL